MAVWRVKLVVGSETKEFIFDRHLDAMALIELMTKGAKYCHFAVEQEVQE